MKNDNFELVPYSLEKATIADLKAKYMDITINPDDKAAYALVMGGLRECRQIRKDVDAWHKERKALILKAGRHYDSEKKRVYGLVSPIEDNPKAARQAEDDRLQAIKDAEIEKEMQRVQNIRDKIESIVSIARGIRPTETSETLQTLLNQFSEMEITEDIYMEFYSEAVGAYEEAMRIITLRLAERKGWEEEQARAKAEAKRLEKERKAQEAERKKLEAEKRAQEEVARKIREAQEAAQRKIDAEKAEIERQKREEQERKERAAFEKKAREEAKLEAERLAKEEAARKAAEEARKLAMAPDREKLLRFADAIRTLTLTTIELGEDARAVFDDAIDQLEDVEAALRETIAETF